MRPRILGMELDAALDEPLALVDAQPHDQAICGRRQRIERGGPAQRRHPRSRDRLELGRQRQLADRIVFVDRIVALWRRQHLVRSGPTRRGRDHLAQHREIGRRGLLELREQRLRMIRIDREQIVDEIFAQRELEQPQRRRAEDLWQAVDEWSRDRAPAFRIRQRPIHRRIDRRLDARRQILGLGLDCIRGQRLRVTGLLAIVCLVLDDREPPHRLLRDRQRPRARLLDQRRPDDPHDREQLLARHRFDLLRRRAESARGAPRCDHLRDLLAGAAAERIERFLFTVATDHVQPHDRGLRPEPELEPDHLVAAGRRVERIGRLAAAARVLRREVAVLRKQRRRICVEHGEPRMTLQDLDARSPQQHRGLALVRGVGPVDLDLRHEHGDAMGLLDRRHHTPSSSPLRSRRAPCRSSCAIVCTRQTSPWT